MRYHERIVMLSVLDGLWKDHLLAMDHLKEGIGLRGYAQQDPLVAYKKESFEMFEAMMMRFQEDTARHLFRMQIIGPDGTPIDPETITIIAPDAQLGLQENDEPRQIEANSNGNGHAAAPQQAPTPVAVPTRAPSTTIDALEKEFQRKKQRDLDAARASGAAESSNGTGAPKRAGDKVGRNDDCPCGSGKKYKKCHGVNA
jgi:preprotein translocase subunit SecA